MTCLIDMEDVYSSLVIFIFTSNGTNPNPALMTTDALWVTVHFNRDELWLFVYLFYASSRCIRDHQTTFLLLRLHVCQCASKLSQSASITSVASAGVFCGYLAKLRGRVYCNPFGNDGVLRGLRGHRWCTCNKTHSTSPPALQTIRSPRTTACSSSARRLSGRFHWGICLHLFFSMWGRLTMPKQTHVLGTGVCSSCVPSTFSA